jgi:hypothetical protein
LVGVCRNVVDEEAMGDEKDEDEDGMTVECAVDWAVARGGGVSAGPSTGVFGLKWVWPGGRASCIGFGIERAPV